MDWEKLKDEIYNCDGSWRDIYVKETTSEDWNSWVTMVNERYRINWHNGKTNTDAAWFYTNPKDAAKEIKDRVAFWRGVTIEDA